MTKLRLGSITPVTLVLFTLAAACARDPGEYVDIERLRAGGEDWKVLHGDTLPEGGSVLMGHDKWLMYFLHWRPLDDEKKNISVAYVRDLIQNFWGLNMPFVLEEGGGETEVAGHAAYYADASLNNGAIRTRFIVWNCPETGRQLVSDCNINAGMGTPEDLLKLQFDVTASIDCHAGGNSVHHPKLTQSYDSEAYRLHFEIPSNWRTSEFHRDVWFPDGMSATNGTVWTLLTDSEKCLWLTWENTEAEVSPETLSDRLKNIKGYRYHADGADYSIQDFSVSSAIEKDGYVAADGEYKRLYEVSIGGQEQTGTDVFLYRAFLWNRDDRTYCLIASVSDMQELWGRPVDLRPTSENFDRIVFEEILPNVKVFD